MDLVGVRRWSVLGVALVVVAGGGLVGCSSREAVTVKTASATSYNQPGIGLDRADISVLGPIESVAVLKVKNGRVVDDPMTYGRLESIQVLPPPPSLRPSRAVAPTPEELAVRVASYKLIQEVQARGGDGVIFPQVTTEVVAQNNSQKTVTARIVARVIVLRPDAERR